MVPVKPILSSLSFLTFLRAADELRSLLCSSSQFMGLPLQGGRALSGRWLCLEQAPSLSDNSPGGKLQPSALPLDSMLGTAASLVCNSPFVWNQPLVSMLSTAGGSCSSPFPFGIVRNPHSLGFSPFSNPRFHRNFWWLPAGFGLETT